MRRKLILIPVCCCVCAGVLGTNAWAQSGTNVLLPHIFRIKASGCPRAPATRVQTGFRVKGEVGIVTALHGVVECKSVTAQSGNDVVDGLIIAKVDIERDIALLWSQSLAAKGMDGLEPGAIISIQGDYELVRVIGYPQGLTRPKTTVDVKITARTQLIDLLPDKDISALDKRSSPAVDIDVLSVQAPVVPGHSGAPFIDRNGRIIGVGSGGLDLGRIDSAWAIPLNEIKWAVVSTRVPGRYSGQAAQRLKALAAMDAGLVFQIAEEPDGADTATVTASAPSGAAPDCPQLNPYHLSLQQLSRLKCSEGPFVPSRYVVTQEFERGFMIVFDDATNSRFQKPNQERKFYALSSSGQAWRVFFKNELVPQNTSDRPEDWFTCEKPPNAAPPQESGIPWRGFGMVWCTYPQIRQALGYVRRGSSEVLGNASFQSYSTGRAFNVNNGAYVVFLNANADGNIAAETFLTGNWETPR